MSMAGQPPTPGLIFETFNAYQRTAALKGAIELELFTAVGEGIRTVPELAQRCRATERGIRILCDYLTVIGFLVKADLRYSLTETSAAFLDRRSPNYIGAASDFLLSSTIRDAFNDVAAVVRKGGTILPGGGSVAPEHPVWLEFARAMAPMTAPVAKALAEFVQTDTNRPLKLLDISASHGLFGLAFAQRNPLAEVFGLDWPNVLEFAKENARKAGVADRYGTIAGSAFDVDYGTGYDIILLPKILHHFDASMCEVMLRKVHRALADDGRVVTVETIPNEDRVSPPGPAAFSLMMLGTTPSGDAHTFRELEHMFRNAGFQRSELHPLPATIYQVVISTK